MRPNMGTTTQRENQIFGNSLAVAHQQMDVAEAVKASARRLQHSASGIGAGDRQWLYDIQRDRVSLAFLRRFMEIAGTAQLTDALAFPEALRGVLLTEKMPALAHWIDATRDEGHSNYMGNVAQDVWWERRSLSAADMVCEAMDAQIVASRILADSIRLEASRSRTIHVVSR